ncbi:MAG: DUF192 domain-containing protein [Candidatus Doudnabacteria bacterium]|nr:DUF192 domain-containing protein [Candidatus Doudnabacteria bacterium]
MNKVIILLFSVAFAAAACNLQETGSSYNDGTVELAGKKLNIELADTQDERAVGLSGREELNENQGMLFVFDEPSRPGFWMKNMKFGIDIIWIRDSHVVDISSNLEPEPGREDYQLKLYQPTVEIDSVLEVNAGWIKKNHIQIGEVMKLQP